MIERRQNKGTERCDQRVGQKDKGTKRGGRKKKKARSERERGKGGDTDSSNRFLGSPVCFLAAESSLSSLNSGVEVRVVGVGPSFGKGLRGMAMMTRLIAMPLRDSPSQPNRSWFEPIMVCFRFEFEVYSSLFEDRVAVATRFDDEEPCPESISEMQMEREEEGDHEKSM
jgi:hypothetical protein